MSARTELLLNFFTTKGYQPILIARSDLTPPDVYLLDHDRYQRLGPLRAVLNQECRFKSHDGYSPALEAVEVRSREAHMSFNFMQKLFERFGWLGASKAKAKLNLGGDELLRFRSITITTVDPTEIEAALNESLDIKKLGAERTKNGDVHVVYEYVYSGGMEVILGNQNNASIDLKASLPNAVEVEAGTSFGKDGVDATAYHKKNEPVAIAFKAAQLVKIGSAWRLKLRNRPGTGFGPPRDPYIFRQNVVLDFVDQT